MYPSCVGVVRNGGGIEKRRKRVVVGWGVRMVERKGS
jgi:hypothetical protein